MTAARSELTIDPLVPVDLSVPDNSELVRGRPFWVESLWHFVGSPIVQSELLPCSALKVWILRLFGASIGNGVYVKPRVRVKFPWYLSIGDHCWIGEKAWIDNMAPVSIASHVCISQEAYLCTGNHDWSHPNMRLFRQPITIKQGAWVAARSMVCPGVTVGEEAIVLSGSVVVREVPDREIHRGNPASFVRTRTISNDAGGR